MIRRPARRLARRVNLRLHGGPGAGEVLRERAGGRLAGQVADHDLIQDAVATRDTRARTAAVFGWRMSDTATAPGEHAVKRHVRS
jgi:hypothetical protein